MATAPWIVLGCALGAGRGRAALRSSGGCAFRAVGRLPDREGAATGTWFVLHTGIAWAAPAARAPASWLGLDL